MATGDDPRGADGTAAGVPAHTDAPEADATEVVLPAPPGDKGRADGFAPTPDGPVDKRLADQGRTSRSRSRHSEVARVVGTAGAARQPAGRRNRAPNADSGGFYAALDLGTNNCRLLVATPRARGFRVVDAFSRIVRLGEGVENSGFLAEDAMARSISALRVCSAKLKHRNVRKARLIATEACRAAENGQAFVDRVRQETGLYLEIVSEQVEARLAVAGCASLVDQSADGVILFDIGGGSSELVWIDLTTPGKGQRRRMADRIRAWKSLPVGVVTLSERHGGHVVTPKAFENMVADVDELLEEFPEADALAHAVAGGGVHMLGTSGTVTTLAGVHLGLPRYDRRQVDGIWLSGSQVAELTDRVAGMDFAERVADPCIGRERADLVISGCAILEAFRRRWPCDRLRVADRGLREGVLVELMAQDGVWRSRKRRGGRHHG